METYRSALILGLGVSGEAAARLLLTEGAAVTVFERRRDSEFSQSIGELRADGAVVRAGTVRLPRDEIAAGAFDVCIVSPGLRPDSDWLADVRAAGIPVLAELELGASRCRCPLLAVTGSNGKSTLVKLCAETLAAAGLRVEVGGNCGPALSQVARRSHWLDWIVAEVSSFQLESVRNFRPRVGVLLNLEPNHLDRHGDMRTYASLKCRLFARMGPDCTAVLPEDREAELLAMFGGADPARVTFGAGPRADVRFEAGNVVFARRAGTPAVPVRGSWFDNPVMGLTAAAAGAAVEACGVDVQTLAGAAAAFRPLPHRMQEVAVLRGVRFIDDSKATNIGAMLAALEMTGAPCRLIAGGLGKDEDLSVAKEKLASRAAAVYLIGKAAAAMEKAWAGTVPCVRCGTLARAVAAAWRDAQAGEAVLLSPGCASFDQFDGYEERGTVFEQAVRLLDEEK